MDAPALKLSQVSFSYPDKPAIFSDLSLEIARGEQVFITGPSGSGKTTLLNLVGGVLLPNAGEIAVSYTHLTLPTICSV